jgi:CheY-like chemotaxis protein
LLVHDVVGVNHAPPTPDRPEQASTTVDQIRESLSDVLPSAAIPAPPVPYTILVIDDEGEVRALVSELLAPRFDRVITAPSGEEGLLIASTARPDLILLDFYLPDMDGLAVLRTLKAHATTRQIPVVALTSASAEQANVLSRAGCVGFIPKPFDPIEFPRVVDQLVRETVGRSRAPSA